MAFMRNFHKQIETLESALSVIHEQVDDLRKDRNKYRKAYKLAYKEICRLERGAPERTSDDDKNDSDCPEQLRISKERYEAAKGSVRQRLTEIEELEIDRKELQSDLNRLRERLTRARTGGNENQPSEGSCCDCDGKFGDQKTCTNLRKELDDLKATHKGDNAANSTRSEMFDSTDGRCLVCNGKERNMRKLRAELDREKAANADLKAAEGTPNAAAVNWKRRHDSLLLKYEECDRHRRAEAECEEGFGSWRVRLLSDETMLRDLEEEEKWRQANLLDKSRNQSERLKGSRSREERLRVFAELSPREKVTTIEEFADPNERRAAFDMLATREAWFLYAYHRQFGVESITQIFIQLRLYDNRPATTEVEGLFGKLDKLTERVIIDIILALDTVNEANGVESGAANSAIIPGATRSQWTQLCQQNEGVPEFVMSDLIWKFLLNNVFSRANGALVGTKEEVVEEFERIRDVFVELEVISKNPSKERREEAFETWSVEALLAINSSAGYDTRKQLFCEKVATELSQLLRDTWPQLTNAEINLLKSCRDIVDLAVETWNKSLMSAPMFSRYSITFSWLETPEPHLVALGKDANSKNTRLITKTGSRMRNARWPDDQRVGTILGPMTPRVVRGRHVSFEPRIAILVDE